MAKRKKSPDRPPAPAKQAASKLPAKASATAPTASESAAGSGSAPTEHGFAVVGIGASAGGLDAFRQFFTALPADSGMAFVLIQHLDPTHPSLTAELLTKYTRLSIVEVTDEMEVVPNRVYVIPPNKYLTISGRKLHLSPPLERRGMRVPIDFFLRSLAEDQRERAIAVVLSGAGSDGTLGIREIKAAGGMVLVQAPETAQADGMPRSALGTGVVDYVLPIGEMPDVLIRYVRHWYIDGDGAEPPPAKAPNHLQAIVGLLRARAKYDFSCYKKGTIARRIHRRMGLHRLDNMEQYVDFLRRHKEEVSSLYKDLLISVTNFFREPEAWEELEEQVLAPLVREHNPECAIRAWTPGCATGEEPYSLAMLLMEQLKAADKACVIQVFASDLDQEALAFARAAVYPENIAADVSPERLKQFFVRGEQTYRVNKEVRDLVVFAEQNLISDPPFSKLDLICCRNLLIYLEPHIQEKVISMFHFALREGGFLFLGSSESINQQEDLFAPVSRRWRIYRRLGPGRQERLELPATRSEKPRTPPAVLDTADTRSRRLASVAQQLMLQRFLPPSVIVNRKCEAIYLHGAVDDFLQLPSGEPASDVLAMARDGLRTRLRSVLLQAIRDEQAVSAEGIRIKRGRGYSLIRITVEPLGQPKATDGLFLVTFLDEAAPAVPVLPPEKSRATPESHPTREYEEIVRHLEDELRATREDLQTTVEELETSNEEYKAAHEEAMSINEELQSTNEEMETSKEELQSLNEELQTVNNQLEQKVAELESANDDLANLLTNTDVATIFLDRDLRIKRYTPPATRLFRMIDGDAGRQLADIVKRFTDDTLLADAETVLQRLTPQEKDVRDQAGRTYARRILPYRTLDNRIDGVVITFIDITAVVALREMELIKEMDTRLANLAEDERQRLGRELHDTLGQQLVAAGLLAAAAREQLARDRDPHQEQFAHIETSLEGARQSLRAIMKGIFPVDVDAHGLTAAISAMVQEAAKLHNVPCEFECPHAIRCTDNFTATQIFLIAREALHNALRHARASKIVIRLEDADDPRITVQDNGIGFAIHAQHAGMGLRIMRHRCGLVGGRFSVESPPEGGTCVTCHIDKERLHEK